MWIGSYAYAETGDRNPVPMSLVLKQQYMTIVGKILEVQTFGKSTAVAALSADIKGVLDKQNIYLVKTYDGSGDQSHSIAYKLALSKDGKTMEGKWIAGEGIEGPVKFERWNPPIALNVQPTNNF